jgi:hypothetical protein
VHVRAAARGASGTHRRTSGARPRRPDRDDSSMDGVEPMSAAPATLPATSPRRSRSRSAGSAPRRRAARRSGSCATAGAMAHRRLRGAAAPGSARGSRRRARELACSASRCLRAHHELVIDAAGRRGGSRGRVPSAGLRGSARARTARPFISARCGSFARSTAACSSSRRELMPRTCVVEAADAAVVAQPAHLAPARIVGRHRAGVAQRAEVLARVEAPRRGVSRGRPVAVPPVEASAVRLRRILEHGRPCRSRDRLDRVHVGGLPVEMHREDGARARRDRRLDARRVQVVGRRIRLDRHRHVAPASVTASQVAM